MKATTEDPAYIVKRIVEWWNQNKTSSDPMFMKSQPFAAFGHPGIYVALDVRPGNGPSIAIRSNPEIPTGLVELELAAKVVAKLLEAKIPVKIDLSIEPQ